MAQTHRRETMLVFGRPSIGEAEIEAVAEVMRSGWVGTGPKAAEFQTRFAERQGVPHAVATNSCTAALHLALLAVGVGPGDEVITSPMTFCATVNVIVHTGARPIFVDCDPLTGNIDPDAIEEKITPRTKALLPTHFAGRPCPMHKIMDIAARHGLRVVEDCAHAIEARYAGKPCGTFGDAGCFSFYVTKNITTVEGGMLITADEAIADRARVMSLHGLSKDAWKRFGDEGYRHYSVTEAGFKYNMIDLLAAIGLCQLQRLDAFHHCRERVWARYMAELAGLPLSLPAAAEPNTVHARHLFTVLLDLDKETMSRDQLLQELHTRNIGTGVHYVAAHLQPFYQRMGFGRGQFPNAENISDRTFSLPLGGDMTPDDVTDVITAVQDVFSHIPRL